MSKTTISGSVIAELRILTWMVVLFTPSVDMSTPNSSIHRQVDSLISCRLLSDSVISVIASLCSRVGRLSSIIVVSIRVYFTFLLKLAHFGYVLC